MQRSHVGDLDRLREAARRQASGGGRSSVVRNRSPRLTPLDRGQSDDGGGGRSLLGQIAGVVSAVPSGLAHLGHSALDSTVGNVGAAVAAATGQSADDVRAMGPLGRFVVNEDTLETASRGGLSLASLKAALPLGVEIGRSAIATGRRIDQQKAATLRLRPLEGPYAQAVREGAIVPTLVEDVGNVAIVASAGGQTLAAGGRAAAARAGQGAMAGRPIRAALTPNEGLPVAGRVGQAAERVARVGRTVDQGIGKALLAPVHVPGVANRATKRLTGHSIGERAAAAFPNLTDLAHQRGLSPRTRPLREQYAEQRQWAAGQVERIAEAAQRSISVVDSPSEAIAGMFRAGGVADALAPLGDLDPSLRSSITSTLVDDPVFRDAIAGATPADYSAGLDLAIATVVDPAAVDPATLTRIERSQTAWDDVAPMVEQTYRDQIGVMEPRPPEVTAKLTGSELLDFESRQVEEGYATDRSALEAEQRRLAGKRERVLTPVEPRTPAEGVETGRLQERAAKLDRKIAKVTKQIAKLDDGHAAKVQAAMRKVTSAPARYRIAINTGQAASRAIDEMVSALDPADTNTASLLRAVQGELVTTAVQAVDQLEPPRFIQGGRVPTGRAEPSASPAARTTKGERLKEGMVPSLTDTDQAVLMSREVFTRARNEVVRFIVDNYGQRVADLVPLTDDAADLSGAQLLAAAQDASPHLLVAWNPRSPLDRVKPDDVTPETVLVPKWATDSFAGEYGPDGAIERAARTLIDTPTRLWKHSVLAASPRWHFANMVGNALMLWSGGVPPHRQLELVKEAKRAMKAGEIPGRLKGSGLSHETSDFLNFAGSIGDSSAAPTRGLLREFRNPNNRVQSALLRPFDPDSKPGRGARILTHPIASSYRFNGWVDDLTHSIAYLDRKRKGYSDEAAVRDALKVAGDFTNLSKFERQFVRRALPFWSWMRHITTLTYDLAANHPLRSAWTLHLWSMHADPSQDMSDIPHLRGSIQVGPTSFVRGANLLPFGTVAEYDVTDPVATIGAAANPFAKLTAEGLTGMEFGPGGLAPLSRPHGTGRLDDYGNPVQGPLSLSEFAHRLLRLTPQTRSLQQLARPREERVVRYDTGQPVRLSGDYGKHTIPDENNRDNSEIVLRGLLGIPVPLESDPAEIRARRDAKRR